jgi:outer membrane protein OmpA-like peptidoglycan-associated protein
MAQQEDAVINPDEFNYDLLSQIFVKKINDLRIAQNKDFIFRNEILEKAATDQSEYMVKIKKTNLEGSSRSKRTTGDRIKFYGGTTSGQEIVQSTNIGKDIKTYYTYGFVADEILTKILKSKKYAEILNNPKAFYAGIGTTLDKTGKRMYISIVIGGLESINEGKRLRKLLSLKYTTKSYGVDRGNAKECRNCERFDDYITLQKGISIQSGKILFEYPNLRKLRKLFLTADDGIAIDIIQKSQYPCDTFNIYDAEKQNRGILLKPIYAKNLWSKNTEPERYNKFSGYIADIPKNILKNLGDQYEINVNIIQKGKFCRRVTRTFTESNISDKLKSISIYPDTLNNCSDCKIEDDYVLDSTSKILSFKIPFDKNKSEYKPRDLEPILTTLNEPKYTINEINVIAYTSLEGDSTKNALLQIKRAKTIIEALEKINKGDILNNIETFDAYEMFKQQVGATEKYMYGLIPKQKLIDTLNSSKKMREDFADILEAERVTMVNMKVTYATQGDDELDFIIHSMKKAIEHNQPQRAKRLQHFAINEAIRGKYSPIKLMSIQVPLKKEYVSMVLNNLFLESRFLRDDSVTYEMQNKLNELEKLEPDNLYVKYNQLVSFINAGVFKDDFKVEEITNRIENLKKTKLPRNLVDALSLELQFKIIDTYDTIETVTAKRIAANAMDRIKNLFAIGTNGKKWENGLKLAEVFIRHNDYKYAMQLLTPFIRDNDAEEKLIFTYISCAARFQENWYTPDFRFALSKARELNSKRYCALFADPYLSIQVLENPLIKKEFCNNCK